MDEVAENLIAAVQMRPAIWDMREKDYGDKLKRKQAWEEIVDMFVADTATRNEKKKMGEQLQKRWKNLRDRYSRDRVTKRRQKSGSPAKRKHKYIHSKEMSFLDDIIQMNRIKSSHEPLSESQQDNETDNTSSSTMVKGWNKRKIDPEETKMLSLPEENAKGKDAESKEIGKNDDDDNLHFLLSLLPVIKRIPEYLKVQSRIDIMKTVNKYIHYDQHTQTQQHNNYVINSRPDTNLQPMTSHQQSVMSSLSTGELSEVILTESSD